ncbi:MAG: cadmium-translocating P-type ATPase [Eubacterium sp.]|nr:cadmium-translocating P-type ATPase [Eubacterium sp.]
MNRKQKKIFIRLIVSAVLLIAFSFIQTDNAYIRLGLFLIPYLVIGYDIIKKAFLGIFSGQIFDENFLMAIATVGAFVIAFFDNTGYAEAVCVMLFYQLGELFQSIAVGKSRRNITALMDIRPDYANVESGEGVERVDPTEVETGSIIVVASGEKIPIDGVVVEGNSQIDTSSLTGESVPREVEEGDEVISGCINLSGVLRIKTTKEFGESTVAKILDLVENSSSKKAKSEQFISKFARYYTPAVCVGALLLAIVPPIASIITGNGAGWGTWVYRALTFLVISCPCALVISIPLSFFAGIGGAGKEGILIKGANYLETLSKTKYIVFDKTGTLTEGVFKVNEVHCEDDIDEDDIIEIAALAESYSSHPISKSILTKYGKSVDKSRVADVREISGYGISAKVDGKVVLAGNAALLKNNGIDFSESKAAKTTVYIAVDGEYKGYILISDVVKRNAKESICLLKNSGVKKAIMLTGDVRETAESVADELEIDEFYSSLLPADKVSKVEELLSSKQKGETLSFVGDGINDAPVLTRADIGIAMGALGSDAAIEAADVVLMDDDLFKIPKAIRISKKCLKIVYENIYFAIGVKLLCLILGALGIANMWLAIFADVGVMVIAVLNAIRAMSASRIRN